MSLRRASTAALLSDKVSRFAHLLQRDVRGNIADESPLVKAVLHEEEDEDGGSVSSNPESGIRELPRRRHSWDLADRDRESHFHFEYEDPSSGGIDVADINEGASAVPTSAVSSDCQCIGMRGATMIRSIPDGQLPGWEFLNVSFAARCSPCHWCVQAHGQKSEKENVNEKGEVQPYAATVPYTEAGTLCTHRLAL